MISTSLDTLDPEHAVIELGPIKPFAAGVKLWLRPWESGDWFALYRAHNVLVRFLFRFSKAEGVWKAMLARFPDRERLYFEGARLNDLIDYHWKRV